MPRTEIKGTMDFCISTKSKGKSPKIPPLTPQELMDLHGLTVEQGLAAGYKIVEAAVAQAEERKRAYQREYCKQHREEISAYQREYRKQHREEISAKKREYRARKKAEKSRREAATSSAAKENITD